ncbi:hypothetical protein ACH433_26540 [Streptomyces olivaceoviridis]|uniref:hypothetical protein n=1 Tax=Streptomyces olivaceoviridis TaxID=1921 RepID=UPI0037A38445
MQGVPALFAGSRAHRPVSGTPVGVSVTRHPDVLEVLPASGTFTLEVSGVRLPADARPRSGRRRTGRRGRARSRARR